MSKKFYAGIIIGLLAAAAFPVIKKFKRQEELFSDEDLSSDNDLLDKANHYLLLARNKVDEMIKKAEAESGSILENASRILSNAKIKAAEMIEKI